MHTQGFASSHRISIKRGSQHSTRKLPIYKNKSRDPVSDLLPW